MTDLQFRQLITLHFFLNLKQRHMSIMPDEQLLKTAQADAEKFLLLTAAATPAKPTKEAK